MLRNRVLSKRIMSPDGKVIAEAQSIAKVPEDQQNRTIQAVSVNISYDGKGCRGRSTSISIVR